jgi:hypothetical protein
VEEVAQLAPVPVNRHRPGLDVIRQARLERLGRHDEAVPVVGRLREAADARRGGHRLAEGHHGVGDLDFEVGVQLAQVVHDAVQVQLPRAQDHVLARLLHLDKQSNEEKGVRRGEMAALRA